MVKADEYCTYEEDGKVVKEKYTEFELLRAKVDRLLAEVILIGKILRNADLKITEETEAATDEWHILDDVYEELEEE